MAMSGNTIYKKLRDQKGATIVEFSFVALAFFILIFGIIQFGLILFNQHIVTNAGREGARYGIVARPDDYKISKDSVEKRVKNLAEKRIVSFRDHNLTVDATFASGKTYCEKFKDVLTVHVKYQYSFIFLPIDPPEFETWTTMICE